MYVRETASVKDSAILGNSIEESRLRAVRADLRTPTAGLVGASASRALGTGRALHAGHSERSKLGESTDPLADVTQGGGAPTLTPTPAPSPVGGGTPTKKAELKSGPTYTPSGTIKATSSGGRKKAAFDMAAEFKHDPSKGIDASVGEVRQYILWTTAADMPNHAGFTPKSDYKENTWYEDRDSVGKRYGHRTGTHAECISVNRYTNTDGTQNCATGPVFDGKDTPMDGSGAKTGEWRFRLQAIDTANGNKVLGKEATVTVDW